MPLDLAGPLPSQPQRWWLSAAQAVGVVQPVGLWTGLVEGGLRSSLLAGRRGRYTKSPPQLGQISLSLSVAQVVQKVHSKEQIRA